jgi:hypothetical protein
VSVFVWALKGAIICENRTHLSFGPYALPPYYYTHFVYRAKCTPYFNVTFQTNVQHFQVLHLTVSYTGTLDAIYGKICWCASGGLRTQFLEDFCHGWRLTIAHAGSMVNVFTNFGPRNRSDNRNSQFVSLYILASGQM